jgi:integrase
MATIEARGGGWRLQWRLGGKRSGAPQSLTFKPGDDDEEETYELLLAAKKLVESRGHAMTRDQLRKAVIGDDVARPSGVPTFEEWIAIWAHDRGRTGEIQADTLKRYVQVLKQRAVPKLGPLPLTEIEQDTVREWVGWMRETQRAYKTKRNPAGKPLAPATIHRTHAILHQCLGSAVPKWLSANPAARPVGQRGHVGLPKIVPHEGMFLEPAEVDAILQECSEQIHDLVYVAVRTGLRLGEILVLQREHVMLTGKKPHIKVRQALKDDGSIGPPKSAKSRRDVTISPEVIEVMGTRLVGKRADAWVFPAPRGGVWNENNLRQRHWLPAVAEAQRCPAHPPAEPPKPARGPRRKLRVDEVSTCLCPGRLMRTPRIHDLRHTHASLLVEAGWLPKRVQMRMGHASFKITMDVYGHLWDLGDDARLDDMERLLVIADDERA